MPKSDSSRMPAAASATQTQVERVARARDRHAERPDELERHRYAQRDAVERLVEGRGSSPRARSRRRAISRQSARRAAAQRGAPERASRISAANSDPQEHGAARARPRRTASSRTRRRTGPTPPRPTRAAWAVYGRAGAWRCTVQRRASGPTRSSSGSSPAWTRRSRSWTSTRCGRTRGEMLGGRAGTPIRVASKSVRCRSLLGVGPRASPASRA